MEASKIDFYYICYYNEGDGGYISYDNEPTNDLDNAMQFKTKEEAEKACAELQKEWKAKLAVTPFVD